MRQLLPQSKFYHMNILNNYNYFCPLKKLGVPPIKISFKKKKCKKIFKKTKN